MIYYTIAYEDTEQPSPFLQELWVDRTEADSYLEKHLAKQHSLDLFGWKPKTLIVREATPDEIAAFEARNESMPY